MPLIGSLQNDELKQMGEKIKHSLKEADFLSWPVSVVEIMSNNSLPFAFFEQDTAWQGPVLFVVNLNNVNLDSVEILSSAYKLGWHQFDWPSSAFNKVKYMFFSIEWSGAENVDKFKVDNLIQRTVTVLGGESVSYLTGEARLIK